MSAHQSYIFFVMLNFLVFCNKIDNNFCLFQVQIT